MNVIKSAYVIRLVCFGAIWGAFIGTEALGLTAWGLSPDLAVRHLVDRIVLTEWSGNERTSA